MIKKIKFRDLVICFPILSLFLGSCGVSNNKVGLDKKAMYIQTDNKCSTYTELVFYPDSKTIFKQFIIDSDLKITFYIQSYENGSVQCKGTFDCNSFSPDSIFSETVFYASDPVIGSYEGDIQHFKVKKHGEWIYYYSNGTIQSRGAYTENLKTGKWLFYNQYGDEMLVRFFDRGIFIKDSIVNGTAYFMPPVW